MKKTKLWVVGKVNSENYKEWEFQGVFSSKDRAVAVCKGPYWFVGPAMLDKQLPEESQSWPGAYYPRARGMGHRNRPSTQELQKAKIFTARETARLIRDYLRQTHLLANFSVRVDRRDKLGRRVIVRWSNGPSEEVVRDMLSAFEGCPIVPGMIDSVYYRHSWLLPDGSASFAGSDWIPGRGAYWELKPDPRARLVLFLCNISYERKVRPIGLFA